MRVLMFILTGITACFGATAADSTQPGRPVRIISMGFPETSKPDPIYQRIDQEAASGVDLIILPETWTGHDLPLDTLEGETITRIAELARKHKTYIVCPIDRMADGKRLNSAVLIDRYGTIAGVYDKVYPYWSEFAQDPPETPGQDAPVFDTDFGRLGIAICFDVNFPEVWRKLADQGAELVVWPSAYAAGRALQAHAINHHYYVVSATLARSCYVFDITGDELLHETSPDFLVSRITLDLDRGIYHQNFNLDKRDRLLREHPEEIEQEKWLEDEQWFVLRAKRPGISARGLAKTYGLEALRDYLDRSRRAIDVKRGARFDAFTVESSPTPTLVPLTRGGDRCPNIAQRTTDTLGIHGPAITGASPGRPFLFRIPATGRRPLTFSADGLPEGLSLDAETGIITGAIQIAGRYEVMLHVKDGSGDASASLTIDAAENALALTPPMGWNSWYASSVGVDAAEIRRALDLLVSTGLADHGYQYICVDDSWADRRKGDDPIQALPKKFPDIKALSDAIHAKGLKFGLYSSPGPKTCAGYEGSYAHESADARQFAEWGVDFLKYDWCSYETLLPNPTRAEFQDPYQRMRAALNDTGRDIVFSLCQYGRDEVWTWGAGVGGNLWRISSDIDYTWESVAEIGFGMTGREMYAGPGHWNDLDMLMIGLRDDASPGLSPIEAQAHLTLWTLQAAPLILSCDLAALTAFELDLLSNDEAIAIDQDRLGKAASRRVTEGTIEIWSRPLADGSEAVGLFNRGETVTEIRVAWDKIGRNGAQSVRDIWQRKDLGVHDNGIAMEVPPHGAALIRVCP